VSVTQREGPPPVWGGVPSRNPNFVGRDDQLTALEGRLGETGVAVLSGGLAVGKTQLAVEYLYRNIEDYDAVWWVSGYSSAEFWNALEGLARRLGVAVDEQAGLAELMASIVDGLPAGRWLLVFDDVESPDTLMSSLPAAATGHVIITARGDYDGGAGDGVGAFSRAESVALLRQRSPSLGEEDADRIAAVLADMPLAVEQAAIYLVESGLSGEEYLTALRERTGSTPFEPIFALAVERLTQVDPQAWWLLRLLAQFEAAEVDQALLVPVADADVPDQLCVLLTDSRLMAEAIRSIARHSLAAIDWRHKRVRLHPLIKERVRAHTAVPDQITLARLAEVIEGRVGTDVDWTTDAPADVDLLKRDALAEVLAGRITETRQRDPRTSLLVHVDGAWGSGKTTLLNLLRARLTANGYVVVWFDAWQHSRLSPPWWALLTAVRHAIIRDRAWWTRSWLRLRETAARARSSGASYLLALILLFVTAGGLWLVVWWGLGVTRQPAELLKVLAPALTALGVLWTGARVASRALLWNSTRGARLFEQSDSNPMARVAEHFAWLLRHSRKPVVFFVDDLDRCRHEYVVELLEAVQTLVRDAPRLHGDPRQLPPAAYFVVAADGVWLRRAYTSEYGATDPLGYHFLDKLFQLTVPMPTLSVTGQQLFLGRLLGLQNDALDPEQLADAAARIQAATGDEESILNTLNAVDRAARDALVIVAARAVSAAETRAHTEHALRKFAPLLSPNPRSTKLFLNTYTMLRAVRTLEGITVESDTLALWTILRLRWPAVADYLQHDPDAVKAVHEPLWCTELLPTELHTAAKSPELRRIVTHPQGGPLTAARIRQCCGTA
jgi:hypothetical protein